MSCGKRVENNDHYPHALRRLAPAPQAGVELRFVIYSREHNAWWAPGRHGYRKQLEQAGTYTKAEADEICQNAGKHFDGGPNEFRMLSPNSIHDFEQMISPAPSGVEKGGVEG